jgi:hypothetical protein
VYGADPGEVPLGDALEAGADLGGTRLDWRAVVASAGFDHDDHEISIARLVAHWRGHAKGSLVVTECTVEGHAFAVVPLHSAALQSWAAQQAAYLAELWRDDDLRDGGDYGDGEDGGAEWLKEGIDSTVCPDPEIRADPNAAFALIEPLFAAALDE